MPKSDCCDHHQRHAPCRHTSLIPNKVPERFEKWGSRPSFPLGQQTGAYLHKNVDTNPPSVCVYHTTQLWNHNVQSSRLGKSVKFTVSDVISHKFCKVSARRPDCSSVFVQALYSVSTTSLKNLSERKSAWGVEIREHLKPIATVLQRRT